MLKLLGSLFIASLCVGCVSHAPTARPIEPADPTVGDLRCAAPRISLIEALYGVRSELPDECKPDAAPRS